MSKKWVLSILIILTAGVALSQAILGSQVFSKKIEHLAEAELEKVIGRPVSIDEASLNLLSSSVSFKGVTLASDTPNRPPLFSAKSIQIYVSPGSIFTEVFLIRKIEIDTPLFQVAATDLEKEGIFKSTQSAQGTGNQGMPKVVVQAIILQDGLFHFEGGTQGLESFSLSKFSSEIKPNLGMDQFDVEFNAEKGMVRFEGEGREVNFFEAQLAIHPDQVQVKKVFIASGKATFLADGQIKLKDEKPLDLHVDLHLPLEEIPLAGLGQKVGDYLKERPISGEIAFIGRLTGAIPNVVLNGKLLLPKLDLDGQSVVSSANGEFSYQDQKIVLGGVSGDLFTGAFSGALEAEWPHLSENQSGAQKNPAFKAQLQYENIPLEQGFALMPLTDDLKSISLKGLFASGDLSVSHVPDAADPLEAKGIARVMRLPLFSPPVLEDSRPVEKMLALFQNGSLKWDWSAAGLGLKEGALAFPETALSFDGKWSQSAGLMLDTGLSSDHVEVFAEVFHLPLKGKLHANGLLSEEKGKPVFHGGFLLEAGTLKGQSFTSLASELHYKEKQLKLVKAVLAIPAKQEEGLPPSPEGLYSAEGTLKLSVSNVPYFDFRVNVQSGNPQEVFQFLELEIPLYSVVHGAIIVRGDPDIFIVKGPFTLEAGSLYGEAFKQGRVDLTVSEKEVLLENAVLSHDKSLVTGKGAIRYDETYSLALKGEGLRVQKTHLLNWIPPNLRAGIGLVVSGEGSFKNPKILFVAAVKDFQYDSFSAGRGRIKADWHDKEIAFEASFPNKNISVAGEVKIAPDFPVHFAGSFEDFEIDPLLKPYLSGPLIDVKIHASGKVSGSGAILKPALLNLSGDLSKVVADFGSYQLENDGPLAIQAKSGKFIFQNTRFKGENTALELNGSLTLLKSWGLFLKGEADLNLITFFSKKIATAQGKAVLDLAISDDWAAPRLRGELTLRGGKIRAVNFSQSLEITSLSAVFNERQVVLDHLQGKLGGGDFYATGKTTLAGFKAGDFGFLLELKKVRLDLADELPGTLRGELFFQRKGLEQTLKGDLVLKNISYEKKVDLKQLVSNLIKKRGNQLSEETPMIGQTKINIHLYGKEDIWISNNLAKMPLVVDLFVKGSFDRPQLLGRVDTADGEIYFRKNIFKVSSGAVNFLSLDDINPSFELNARTTARNEVTERNYDIDLGVSGTLSQITLTWNSFPSLPEGDILALLAIGRTTAELARGGGGAGNEATHFVVSELFANPVEQVTEIVGAPVEQITGIDQIRVEPSIDGTDANATVGTRLTAEKRLMNDRLVVIYQTTLDPSEEEVIRMVYEVDRNISLVGKRDKDGQIGGDIRFRFEFR